MALRQLGNKFPSVASFEHSINTSRTPLADLRSQIWRSRAEYYGRRYAEWQKNKAQGLVCIGYKEIIKLIIKYNHVIFLQHFDLTD